MTIRKLFIGLLFISISTTAYSQDRKVAVVTFYVDKKINLDDLGLSQGADLLKLEEYSNFNLTPILASFHTIF